jgi:nicotinate-nucleotide pyrophosphorylase (carboxylating)
MTGLNLDEIIDHALAEDLGDGDHTSLAIFPEEQKGSARLLIKDEGVLAGIPVAERIFGRLDPSLTLNVHMKDGDQVRSGDVAFDVSGRILPILAAERLVLNFLQRLSGIATSTANVVNEIKGTKAKILDTRKTTPNLRELEKYAVRVGGGTNHRIGLYDMILIKDNHVDFAGGVVPAIEAAHKYLGRIKKELKIEIEVRNFKELLNVIHHGKVDRILLDNFSPGDMAEAVQLVRGRFETEASGGISLHNVRQYAETGVDYISIGALTHNFRSLDMSLKARKRQSE